MLPTSLYASHLSLWKHPFLFLSSKKAPHTSMRRLSLEFLAFATTLATLTEAAAPHKCYGIDLVQDPNSFPCDPSAENGPCCALGNTCLSNGLCSPNSTQNFGETPYYTSECTDSTWQSSSCLEICNTNTSCLWPPLSNVLTATNTGWQLT